MSDLLLIEGGISAGAGETVRVEPLARSGSGWNLPLAGAVLLHLALLVLAVAAPRLGGARDTAPAVYPIRLYTVAEVFPESVADAHPDRPVSFVRQLPAVVEESAVVAWSTSQGAEISPAVVAVPTALATEPVSLSEVTGAVAPAAQPFGTSPRPAVAADTAGGRVEVAPAGGASAGAAVAAEPVLVQAQPLYRENPPPEYPPLARRRNLQGTVLLEVLVDGRGQVGELTVHRSSGQRLLDEAALRSVKGWRFEPGHRGGEPLAMKVLVPVRFSLN